MFVSEVSGSCGKLFVAKDCKVNKMRRENERSEVIFILAQNEATRDASTLKILLDLPKYADQGRCCCVYISEYQSLGNFVYFESRARLIPGSVFDD